MHLVLYALLDVQHAKILLFVFLVFQDIITMLEAVKYALMDAKHVRPVVIVYLVHYNIIYRELVVYHVLQ